MVFRLNPEVFEDGVLPETFHVVLELSAVFYRAAGASARIPSSQSGRVV